MWIVCPVDKESKNNKAARRFHSFASTVELEPDKGRLLAVGKGAYNNATKAIDVWGKHSEID